MDIEKKIGIFIVSNLIASTTLLSQDKDIEFESIGINTGYSKLYYTSENMDVDKPKTNLYNIELYTVVHNIFDNNTLKATFNYIYTQNDDIKTNSFLGGLNRYDNFDNFTLYSGLLVGYSQLDWNHTTTKEYESKGFIGGIQAGLEFSLTNSWKFNINTKYLLNNHTIDLSPQYSAKLTHTGSFLLAFGVQYLFGTSIDSESIDIYHIGTDDDILEIEVHSSDEKERVHIEIEEELKEFIDSDNDGITDMLDNCSDSVENEIVDDFGCAKDSDDDFILDRLDLCINSVENEIVDSSGCAKDSDGDGVIDRLDHCINSIQDEIVDKSGCAKDSDDDGFIDRLDNCPDSIKGAIVDEFGCEPKNTPKEKPIMTPVDTNISQEGENSLIIKFSYKSEELTQTSQEDIEGLINHLNKFPNDRIVMKSYTDSIGSARYNLKLSAKRSKSVLNILIDYGIDMKRVSIHNMGESSPIASNLLKSGREKNRRIEIKIIKFD